MKAPTLVLAAFVALCSSELLSTTHAVSSTVIKKNCLETTVCYKGSMKANACTVKAASCPPCVKFEDSGCYEIVNGGCPFSLFDCSPYWDANDTPPATGGSGSGGKDGGAAGNGGNTPAPTTNSTTKPPAPTSRSPSSGSGSSGAGAGGSAGNPDANAKADDGNDMSAIFAIIGATMGVIAVAVIFLTLVRRSRAARNDDDDDAATPPAMAKDPQSATAAVTYASYAAGTGTGTNGAGTVGTRSRNASSDADAAMYYNQKPQTLPIASPRVAGRAVPAATAAPRAQQPMLSNPAPVARAMPMFANKAPLATAQQAVPEPVQLYYQVPAQETVTSTAQRRMSSPRMNRRDSFEF